MPLLSLSLARRFGPALWPLRALVAGGWLQESELDCLLRRAHPVLRLNRVFARVESRRWVADDMLALGLRTNGNAHGWRPGQHVRLYQELDGVRHGRSYSLLAAEVDGRIELAVKRQPGGRLSNGLLDRLEVGHVLELEPAQGELAWPSDAASVLLLAAGSGITPLLGLLRQALARGFSAPVTLLHYVRRRSQRAFSEELQALMRRHPNLQVRWAISGEAPLADELMGRFRADHLAGWPAHSLLACGPHGFVAGVRDWWQALPRDGSLQLEAFTPPAPAVGIGTAVRLRFARSHRELPGSSAVNLLEQAESHGLRPPHGCRQGICAGCTCQLLAGSVRDLRTGAVTAGPGLPIRLCVSAPVGDVELEL
ncbi:ferredoxin reductase [Pseudomonas sp. JS3066]|uniref:ferredoxin reductase n=1 Tax=unclassified Pseudomonas TaxID=196821 RepID=UPI00129DE8BD|nr:MULTISPECIES: ferredoxin reductase [unclassified Pseudomonas]MDH4655228.1 ferredoxin reductase [Pseudomonas sp. BN606]MRK20258.1 ferredoxin reductase [Pseudomonas sp. JG-B]WVK92593.1 ferredoxin reductase [Pseudomonas sp. JS3066]